MTKKKSVLIIDDHPLVREGLKVTLGRGSGFEVVGEAGTALQGLRMAGELKPDIMLIDISLPDESGIELTRKISRDFPGTRILIVSMYVKMDYIAEAFRAGATGYLAKESAAERLISALEFVAKGERYLDGPVANSVIQQMVNTPEKGTKIADGAYMSLTPREQEILRVLAEGLSVQQIADRFFISPKTVENHRTNIMNKLGLRGSIELARYAARIGLIDIDRWKE